MCLMVHQPAGVVLPDDLIKDVYSRNSDGVGVMWADDGKLKFRKAIVADEDAFLKFYKDNIEGKECVWHARMMTHGDINLENCHPYPVFGFDGVPNNDDEIPMLMMHNGILDYGNSDDKSKSDTWHYIRNFLWPMLKHNTEFAFTSAFKSMVGKHITGSNRFAFMDPLGRVVIINKATGVEYMGAWFSNTYAWASNKYLPSKYSNYYQTGSSYTGAGTGATALYPTSGQKALYPERGSQIMDASREAWETELDSSYDDWKKRNAEQGITEALPKSKNQLKREHRRLAKAEAKMDKALARETSPQPGPDTGTTHPTTTTIGEPKSDTVPMEVVDDVLEGRSILEVAYPDAPTRDSQMAMMVQEMTPEKFFLALELLHDQRIPPNLWDSMAESATFARQWARYATKQRYEKIPMGYHARRAGGTLPALEATA